MKKLLSILSLLVSSCASVAVAQSPPQVINKLCSPNTFFSQIQPGPNNIQCTQPSYSGLSGLPAFIRSLQYVGGSASLVGDSAFPGASKFYGTDASGVRGFYAVSTDVNVVGALDGATASVDGGVISGNTLYFQSASSTRPGLVNNSAQNFSGNKIFTGTISASNFSGSSSGVNTGNVSLGTANGLGLAGQVLSLGLSSASTNGALSSADWLTFDGKEDALTFTAPLINTAETITCRSATGLVSGCLSASDWNTFNDKQVAGNYITALNSDVVAAGPGSATATIQNGVVSNAKLATMGSHTVKGNNTASTASPSDLAIGSVTEATSDVLTITGGTNSIIGSGLSIEVLKSDTLTNGYLSAVDWNTFDEKQDALLFSAPLVNTADTISCNVASGSQAGCLSSTDWSTFNGKQAAGNYLTALTGDGSAAGPGSAALTLATVNSNVGSFGSASASPNFTVNGKGLITAAGSSSIQIAESQVTNLVSDLAGKQPTGNYITALSSDVVASGPGAVSATIQPGVVSNSKLATMTAHTVKANATAGTATPTDVATGTATEDTSSVLTLSGWSNATIGSPTIQVKQSSTSQSGYLSSTDWNTFNGKQSALTFGNLTDAGTDGISVTNGTGAVIGSGTSFAQHVSDSTHNGYLSSTDWSTFNGKQDAGNYLTALTGDLSASGPGSASSTLATVNSNVGSFGGATSSGTFTVNGKGLITAASSTAIQIAESQVTNLVSDLAGKQATGNYITSLTSEVTASGPGAAAATLLNSAVIGKVLTGYTSGAGTVAATDTILQAIQKLNGNDALKVPTSTTISTTSPLSGGGDLSTNRTLSLTTVPANLGGTGVANNAASTLTISGNFGTTLTVSNTTALTLPTSGTVATLAGSETFTNKTLTTPIIASISNSGTITIPTGTDTLVGKATTDTLTNKTLTTPTINQPITNGVTNASNAASGVLGEFISANGTNTSGNTQGTTINLASISLTAGDWDVQGSAALLYSTVSSPTRCRAGISLTSATLEVGSGGYSNFPASSLQNVFTFPTGTRRINVSTPTTVYIVGECTGASGTFTTDTPTIITARRMR